MADDVDDRPIAVVVGVEDVEDEAARGLEPSQPPHVAVARQEPDPGVLVLIPEPGPARPRRLGLEGHRQVEHDDARGREGDVVDHRRLRQVDPRYGGGAARRVEGDVPHGQARLVSDRVLHPRRGVVPGMRREAGLQRAAEVGAGDALQALIELDRQVAGLDQRVELAGRNGEVGIDLAVATAGARAGDRGAAEG